MEIPNSHLSLLTEPIHGILTTIMPSGQPQSSIVWCGYENGLVLMSINVYTTISLLSSLYSEMVILFCSKIFQTCHFSKNDYRLFTQTLWTWNM